jgi:hypothetical protein
MEYDRDVRGEADDYVSARIRMLAVGMAVLFVVFAACDWLQILPMIPGSVTP